MRGLDGQIKKHIVIFFAGFILIFLPGRSFAKNIYKHELKKWTRIHEVYQRKDLFASIRWHATFQSPDFIKIKSDKMASFYKYHGVKKEELRRTETSKFLDSTSFYISFYCYEYKYSDISNPANHWKLYLEVDGLRYEPVKYEQIEKLTPLYEVLYPYSNIWSRHYYVYFPSQVYSGSPMKLIITGPTGSSELNWE